MHPYIYEQSLVYDNYFPEVNGNLLLAQFIYAKNDSVRKHIDELVSIFNFEIMTKNIYDNEKAKVQEDIPDSVKTIIRQLYHYKFVQEYGLLINEMADDIY